MLSCVAYHCTPWQLFHIFLSLNPNCPDTCQMKEKGHFFPQAVFHFCCSLRWFIQFWSGFICRGKNCLYFQKTSEKAVNVQSTETEAEQRSGFGSILSNCHRMWFVRWRRPRLWLPCPRTRRGRRSSVHCHCLCHFHCPNRPRRLTSCPHFLDPVAVGSRTTTVVERLLCCWRNPHLQFRHSHDDQ